MTVSQTLGASAVIKLLTCINNTGPKFEFYLKVLALASGAQWIECQPANQGVVGSIPSQGTCLGCRPGPQ